MGLDITSKKDYYRFNWSGVSEFLDWNRDNGLPEPFVNWTGDNSGRTCNPTNPDHKEALKAWCTAFEELCPELTDMGPGDTIQTLLFDAHTFNHTTEPWSDDTLELWHRYRALGWYWFVKDKLRTKHAFAYC